MYKCASNDFVSICTNESREIKNVVSDRLLPRRERFNRHDDAAAYKFEFDPHVFLTLLRVYFYTYTRVEIVFLQRND